MFEHAIDISRLITPNALVYPGDAPLEMERVCRIGPGCPFNLTRLGWSTHFLTHIDVPLHFFESGAAIDDLSVHRFLGPAVVVEVSGDAITPEHVPEAIAGLNLLFKTRNSDEYDPGRYNENHVYLTGEAAGVAVARGANLVGIDYLSIDRYGDDSYPAHRALLGNNVLILEGCDLSTVSPGHYDLIALPLKIAAGDGSPVRAVLLPR